MDNAQYTCKFISHNINIDGSLTDPAWQLAENARFYIPETLEEPESKTEAKILYSKDYLYVGFKAYDKDIRSVLTEQDSQTCLEDCLEIFFKPFEDNDSYYNFEINALGTVYDALSMSRPPIAKWAQWDCKDLQVGINICGEINNPEVVDEYWQMEVGIPFASLPSLEGKSPRQGDIWKFHLARYDYSRFLAGGVELCSTAPLSRVDFHYHEEWIPLIFGS